MQVTSLALILAASLSLLACGPRNQDKLEDNELATAAGSETAQPDTRCDAQAAQDEVKRQLFARAAEIRGSNGDSYARIADFALVEIEGAAPDASAAPNQVAECRGRATLRLPAGLKVAGGRTTLGGDISYSIAPGARGTVTLGQSDAIAIPLATLTQRRAAPPPAPVTKPDPIAPAPDPAPSRVVDPATAAVARPSFDCRSARTQSEQAVCASPTLAGLDQEMAAHYRTAIARSDPPQARLLRETRDRFLGYRDRCPSDSCIANTYRGRMREIDDILANRWQGRTYRPN